MTFFAIGAASFLVTLWLDPGRFPMPRGHHPEPFYLLLAFLIYPLVLALAVMHLQNRAWVMGSSLMLTIVMIAAVGSLAGLLYSVITNAYAGLLDFVWLGLTSFALPLIATVHLFFLNEERLLSQGVPGELKPG